MADNFGFKIGVEGEKEFKKALSEINGTMKVLGSEMKLVESSLKNSRYGRMRYSWILRRLWRQERFS